MNMKNKGTNLFSLLKNKPLKKEELKDVFTEHEKVLSIIYDNITIGFSVYDSNGNLIDINNALLKMLGIPNKESVKGICLFDDPQNPKDQVEKFRRGENTDYILKYKIKDSKEYLKSTIESEKTFQVHLFVHKDSNDKIALYIFSIEDVTEKENYRLELENKKEEFESLYIRNRELMKALPIGVGIFNKNGDRTFINEAWVNIFGMSSIEEANKQPTNIFTLPILNDEAKAKLQSFDDMTNMRLVYDFGKIKAANTYT